METAHLEMVPRQMIVGQRAKMQIQRSESVPLERPPPLETEGAYMRAIEQNTMEKDRVEPLEKLPSVHPLPRQPRKPIPLLRALPITRSVRQKSLERISRLESKPSGAVVPPVGQILTLKTALLQTRP